MGTGCLPKSNTLVEEQVFVLKSIPEERMPPSTAASVGGWPGLPGEWVRCCGHSLASPRLVWGSSQALKPCSDPSPDTLPGPGSESQPQHSAPGHRGELCWPPCSRALPAHHSQQAE